MEQISAGDIKTLTKSELLEILGESSNMIRGDSYQHQLATSLYIYLRKNGAAVFNGMGTGKTKSSLDGLRLKGIKDKILVITVNDSMVEKWLDEVRAFTDYRPVGLLGSPEERLELLDTDKYDCFVINFDGMLAGRWNKASKKGKRSVFKDKDLVLFNRLMSINWNAIIVDESRRCKNKDASRTKALLMLGVKSKFNIILTGTPMIKPIDIWSQFRFMDGGETFGNFYDFRRKFFYKKGWKRFATWELKSDMEEEFYRLIGDNSIQYSKEECLDLPDKVLIPVPIVLSPSQMGDYIKLKYGECDLDIADIAAVSLGGRFMKYQQITGGFMKIGGDIVPYSRNPKMEVALDLIQDAIDETKVIVFHKFIHEGRAVEEHLKSAKIKYASLRSEIKDKPAQVDKFKNDDRVRVMVAHPRSGGIGLDMVNANVVIYYSQDFDVEARLQSEDRAHRIGQKNSVKYYTLTANNTIDEAINKAHERGIDVVERVKASGGAIMDLLDGII